MRPLSICLDMAVFCLLLEESYKHEAPGGKLGASYFFNRRLFRFVSWQTLIQNAAALGRPVSVAGRTQLLSNGTDDDLTAYYAIGGRAPVISDKFDEVSRGEVFQLLMGCRESDWPAILKGTSGAKIAAWWDRAVDIIPSSGGKGAGIRKVLAYYGLTPEVFGSNSIWGWMICFSMSSSLLSSSIRFMATVTISAVHGQCVRDQVARMVY